MTGDVWKICFIDTKGRFVSSVATREKRLEYVIGARTTPTHGKLFAYNTYASAIQHINRLMMNCVLLKATAQIAGVQQKERLSVLSLISCELDELDKFWKTGEYGDYLTSPIDSDVILCDWIEPVELIDLSVIRI